MVSDKIIELINKNFYNDLKGIDLKNGNEIYIDVYCDKAYSICKFIYSNLECSLISMIANDEMQISGCMAVYYSFSIRSAGLLVIVKTALTTKDTELQSITPEIHAAALYEREIRDMYGINFAGHPDERELVFHPNWPENLHPLDKNFNVAEKPSFVDRHQEFLKIDGTGVFEIPVGPVHAGIIEPGHFRFSVAGEPIINLEAKLYFVHKGIEKLSENQSIEKVLFISERISGDETFTNSLAYCQAIERISGVDSVPERARYGRTILGELERIYTHLGDIQGICIDVAYGFAAYQFGMMRRWMQMLNEEVTGSRFLRSSNKPGGLRKDFIKFKENTILTNLLKLEKEFNETVEMIRSNSLFIDRVENTGVIPLNVATDLNAVGPAARAIGILSDVRRDFPYAAYNEIDFKVPLHKNGDVSCRMNVKINELNESINIIRQAIEKMPQAGSVSESVTQIAPYKVAFGLTEAPRGENCHWIMSGEKNTILRYKIRTPSFCNWPVLCHAVKGNVIPDFPLINKSFNLSYSGNDL